MRRSATLQRLPGMNALVIGLMLAAGATVGMARAEPYVPTRDDQVLVRVPVVADGERASVRALRRRLDADPADRAAAVELAGHYLQRGRADGDPRWVGYAQAVLAPWWETADPPPDVRVLRATILQNRHDFGAALSDLEQVLKVAPRDGQARLMRAAILRAQGRVRESAAECAGLLTLTDGLVVSTCLADATSLLGHARRAYEGLLQAYGESPDADPRVRLWALTVLAEIAARLGDTAAAGRHFKAARALGVRDAYLLAAEADFLLDEGRPAEARALLMGQVPADALLLRLAIAERRLGDPAAGVRIEEIRSRFAAARARNDGDAGVPTSKLHLREEARFALELLDDASAALNLAEQNWHAQREPADARLLLEAARAAGEPSAARPVLDWMAETGIEDLRLRSLAASLRASPAG